MERSQVVRWLVLSCDACGEPIPVRQGEQPKRTTASWNVQCSACGRHQSYPRGTMMHVIER